METKPKLLPYFLLLIHSVIIGLSYIFVKLSMQQAETFDVLAQRFSLAFLAVLLYNLIKKPDMHFSGRDLVRLLPLGILYPITFFLLQIFGLRYATAMQTGIVTSIAPVVTIFFARFLIKEPIRSQQVVGVLVAVLGVILLQWMNLSQSEVGESIGFVLVFASVFVMSLNIVLTRSYTKEYSWEKITTFIISLSWLFFNLLALGRHLYLGEWASFFTPLMNQQYLLVLAFLGVLSSFGTSLITAYALTHVPSVPVAVFASFSPLVTIPSSILILGEPFYWYHLAGGILITLGALVTNLYKRKQSTNNDRKVA